jgi:hypothetical protein
MDLAKQQATAHSKRIRKENIQVKLDEAAAHATSTNTPNHVLSEFDLPEEVIEVIDQNEETDFTLHLTRCRDHLKYVEIESFYLVTRPSTKAEDEALVDNFNSLLIYEHQLILSSIIETKDSQLAEGLHSILPVLRQGKQDFCWFLRRRLPKHHQETAKFEQLP